jgi:hypothetical protein
VNRTLDHDLQALIDPLSPLWTLDFVVNDAENVAHEGAGMARREGMRVAAGKSFGAGPFEHPGGRPPMSGHGLIHDAEWADLGFELGVAEACFEFGVATGLAVDRSHTAADVAGRFVKAQPAGNEGAYFTAFCLI